MAKGMDRGNVGHTNKPKLSIQEKKLKKKMKMQTKSAAAAAIAPARQ
ncbi:MAG: hypothetical protein Q7J98_13050 [Kiritimatiellia bacterium]|nr:hypothetical protein [Kiritimatiellia bacterium]